MCFTPEEFSLLLSGLNEVLVDDWQKHTTYTNCSDQSTAIKWFWEAVESFSQAERKRLLRFATGQASPPIGGFHALKSDGEVVPFNITLKAAPTPSDIKSFYPTAATCGNSLQLPDYKEEETLRSYLLLAIQEDNMS